MTTRILWLAAWACLRSAHAFAVPSRALTTRGYKLDARATAVQSVASPPAIVDYRLVLAKLLSRFEERLGPLQLYEVPDEFKVAYGSAGTTKVVTEVCAFAVGPLRHIRAALIAPEDPAAPGARVLNFVAFPHLWTELPVFGADCVSLPGGHLVAIDLHPMAAPAAHAACVLPRVGPVHEKHQGNDRARALLPWGGALPEEALPFFSPAALWTRLPADAEGTARLQALVCDGALPEYLEAFLDLASAAPTRVPGGSEASGEAGSDEAHCAAQEPDAAAYQRAYSAYRVAKDPARGMLTRMHGEAWADRLISEVLFDFELHGESRK